MIQTNHGLQIDLDSIPLDDELTYKLYQNGATDGTFQFESAGMQKYLKELRPDKFDDLIAMNALYRPGPIAYIPNFIERKHGREPITYDLPEMEEYLAETYGITTYQEQVMLLSQKLANFTKGDADVLRKAIGKKQLEVLNKMKAKFIEGCTANGHKVEISEKIWKDWEAFAEYAFNKSHSTCYALVAFQTAYLKAHYPSEYMAAVLNGQGNIEKTTFYMEECRRMGLKVLGPDINEGGKEFAVSAAGVIRFGMNKVKGVGETAVEDIIAERKKNGVYKDIFDLVKRVPTRSLSKSSLEKLVQAGALDGFTNMHRAQYFQIPIGELQNNLERIIKYGQNHQNSVFEMSNSLFGAVASEVEAPQPKIAPCEPWTLTELLEKEKDVVGMYITAHPLDNFRFELNNYNIQSIADLKLDTNRGKTMRIAGFVSNASHLISKKGTKYARVTLIDYTDQLEIMAFTNDYVQWGKFFEIGQRLIITGSYQPRPYSNDDESFEFKIQQVSLLENVKTYQTKKIEIAIPAETISIEFIQKLQLFCRNNIGTTQLSFTILDTEKNETIHFKSTKGVVFKEELLQLLQEEKKLHFRIQT